ncbi:uncharacterized protein CLUP02_16652 [Colletotrichum lupini]|uniref:Uncharacterized protein n=1 Tax=Colletotrichum lupini TaxID=145971 RepID=A0A9Q8WPE4_9PEZI|nr:uncharacterized protein CLUP02_16652 [Colletotrichum lupini]KAK1707293.1 hypothetical protein BDP67DRAFT_527740 [Colletotrichum lupini]UQC91118.1 hypothetical protein CLUP02_16652 [Colletotrichum lupini]
MMLSPPPMTETPHVHPTSSLFSSLLFHVNLQRPRPPPSNAGSSLPFSSPTCQYPRL